MSTGSMHSPQTQHNTEGKRHSNAYSHPHRGVVSRKASDVPPFPTKPVIHRPLRMQVVRDIEKMTISTQPGDLQFSHPKKDFLKHPGAELQMAREIHEKKLMIQEKLWKVEEQIRQKIQRDGAAGEIQKTREDRPVRNRDTLMQDRGQGDVKQQKNKQGQQTEGDMSIIPEETHQIICKEQEVSGEINQSRWKNVKEHTRRKREDEKDYATWREEEKTKHNKQNKIYGERTHVETDCSVREQDTALKMVTEKHRASGGLPLDSSPVPGSGPQRAELIDSTDISVQCLPCKVCNRKFVKERLDRHVQICKKVKQSHRQVYNSYAHRTKGSDLGEFLKTHTRSETPEGVKRKNQKRNYKGNISNLHQSQLPAGTTKTKQLK